MSFVKNDIPILEYDSDPVAVIMPDHEDLRLELPERAAFVFLGDTVDRYAEAVRAGAKSSVL